MRGVALFFMVNPINEVSPFQVTMRVVGYENIGDVFAIYLAHSGQFPNIDLWNQLHAVNLPLFLTNTLTVYIGNSKVDLFRTAISKVFHITNIIRLRFANPGFSQYLVADLDEESMITEIEGENLTDEDGRSSLYCDLLQENSLLEGNNSDYE